MVALYPTVRFGFAKETADTVKKLLTRPPISLGKYIVNYKSAGFSLA